MEEKELIGKIKELRQIKPDKDWVVLIKREILGQEPSLREQFSSFWKFQHKPVFAVITTIMLLLGVVIGSFYSVKDPVEIVEIPVEPAQVQAITLSLEELQLSVIQATEELKKIREPQKVLKAGKIVVPAIEAGRIVVSGIEKLEEDAKTQEEQVLAIKTGANWLENALADLEHTYQEMMAKQVAKLIENLEGKTLTEEHLQLLEKAKKDFEAGLYSEALEKILTLRYPQE